MISNEFNHNNLIQSSTQTFNQKCKFSYERWDGKVMNLADFNQLYEFLLVRLDPTRRRVLGLTIIGLLTTYLTQKALLHW